MISIDGTSGAVFLGEVPVVPSPVVQYFEGTIDPETSDDPLVKSVHRLMVHADEARRLGVEANADTPEDAARARRFGAGGIGLCRTEHMFLGDRREARRAARPGRHRRREGLRAGRATADATPGLHRDPGGDGRPAGHHPSSRPAPARVPAVTGEPVRRAGGRPGDGQAARQRAQYRGIGQALRRGRPPARAGPHARDAGRAPRPGRGRAVRAAGAGDLRGGHRCGRCFLCYVVGAFNNLTNIFSVCSTIKAFPFDYWSCKRLLPPFGQSWQAYDRSILKRKKMRNRMKKQYLHLV